MSEGPVTDLERLAKLIKARNANELEITEIIGRPAQIGHVGEYQASAIFAIDLAESAVQAGYGGHFARGPLAAVSVNVILRKTRRAVRHE